MLYFEVWCSDWRLRNKDDARQDNLVFVRCNLFHLLPAKLTDTSFYPRRCFRQILPRTSANFPPEPWTQNPEKTGLNEISSTKYSSKQQLTSVTNKTSPPWQVADQNQLPAKGQRRWPALGGQVCLPTSKFIGREMMFTRLVPLPDCKSTLTEQQINRVH